MYQTCFSKSDACLSTAFETSQVSETSSACLLSNYAFFSCNSLHLQLSVGNVMQSRLDAAQQLLPLPHSLSKSLASLLTFRLERSKACSLQLLCTLLAWQGVH